MILLFSLDLLSFCSFIFLPFLERLTILYQNFRIILGFNLIIKNTIITGEVTEQEKMEAYAGADIFCSPSHYEAFCISILEAMSQGCAVITSNAGGMPWVVGKEGLTFQDYDLEDFKKQLSKLINNKKLKQDFQKQGKIKSKNFKWKNTAEVLDREYKKFIQ